MVAKFKGVAAREGWEVLSVAATTSEFARPVAPVAPVAPVGPVGPVGPVAPVGPVTP